jgi:Chaperone of endosialidase
MALTDKDILITPNKGQTAEPKIEFKGASATQTAQTISLNVYPTDNGTISFEGSAGQLFSITNSLSGTIYSVNDVSGIPSIEVLDTGNIKLGQYNGNILIGTATDNGTQKLQVNGGISLSGNSIIAGDNHLTFGPNSTWGSSLRIGGNGRTATGTEMASVVTTDGNLHLDAAASANGLYLNYYAGTSGILFGNGASGIVAVMGPDGDLWKGSSDNTGTQYVQNTGTWGISITGSAATLTTARTINGVSFNGSANITITANTPNTLTMGVSGTGLSGSATFNGSAATTFTVTSNATNANTASTIVARDASGNFSAGTITATLSGNASTVTNGLYTTTSFGGDVSGTYNAIVVADDSHNHAFNNLTSKTGGTGTYTTSGDYRAPIFYDSNDTNYYVDPNSVSSFAGLNLNSGWYFFGDENRDMAAAIYYPNSQTRAVRFSFANASTTGTGGNYAGVIHFHPWSGTTASTGDASYQIAIGSSAVNGTGVPRINIRNGIDTTWNSWYTAPLYGVNSYSSSLYATIYYDSDNTAYYTDPAGTSNLSGLTVASTITGSISGNAGTATTLQTARTINGVSFNGSANITITANTPNTLTLGVSGTGLSGSATFNGGAATTFTVTSNATSANTASAIVARDASGNFSAGTITAALTGNASTATTLQTARTINGISFNGSANIVVPTIYDTGFKSIINPDGAQFVTGTATVTGAIAVTLPVGMTNSMIRMTIRVYEYTTNESFDIYCGGYTYTTGNTWANNPFAYIVGNPGIDRRFTVRFGYTAGGKAVVYIGELASTWSYPQVFVTDIQCGYSGNAVTYTTGWSIGFQSSAFENVTATITNSQVGYAVSTNTANSSVLRDASGNFSAGTITATLSGNASTASSATRLTNFTSTTTTSAGTDNTESAVSYISGISLFGQTDGALYSHVYSSSWKHNIYGDYRTGQLAVRGKNNGTWQSWRTVWDSGNLTNLNQLTNGPGYITGESDTLATVTGRGITTRASSGAFATNTQGTPGLEIIGGGSTEPAYITFHRPNVHAVRFGLDGTDLKVGGWSMGNVAYKLWHEGNDGSGSTLDADLLDGNHASAFATSSHNHSGVYVERDEVKSFGTIAVQAVAGSSVTCTTAQFITWLENQGFFDYVHSYAKCSWDYAGNNDISDTGFGANFELAGCVIETWTDNSDDTTRGNITVQITAPTTGGTAGSKILVYNDQGSGYSPGWRQIWNSNTLTNLNQLTNGPGYITGESDTLATVTGRGATTSTLVRINNQLQVGQNTNGTAWIDAYGGFAYYGADSNSTGMKINSTGNATFYADVRSPIYYDSADTGYYWNPNTSSAHRLQTPSGYLDLGPMNTSWCHFQTDRSAFYFGSSVAVNGEVKIYSDQSNRFAAGTLVLRGGTPTIYMRDTDNNVAMLHCNSNLMYILRGATDSETWTQVGSYWPVYWDLTNNNATFGGSIWAASSVTAYSDLKLKENIQTIDNALSKTLQLRGVYYTRKDDENKDRRVGVIAQEIKEVLPEVVRFHQDAEDIEGTYAVDYGNITGLLIEAIKEQQSQIDELKELVKKLLESK